MTSATNASSAAAGDPIVDAQAILVSIPFQEGALPVWNFGAASANRFDTLLVRIETEAGLVGWGEAFSRCEDVALMETTQRRVLTPMIGWDSMAIGAARRELEFALQNFGRNGGQTYALSAVDIALWDIAGQRAGLPLWALLGGARRREVEAYASLLRYGERDALVAACEDAIGRGYRVIKLHEVEIDLIEAAVETCRGRAAVTADMNCCWTPAEAMRLAPRLDALDLLWLEEPVWPPENLAGLARLRGAMRTPISSGENAGGLHDFHGMISSGAIDIAQPDIAKSGGVSELTKISALCEAHAVAFEPHCALFGPGQVATIHLIASHAAAPMLERLFCDFEAELYGRATIPVDGRVSAPDAPGLGLAPDPEVISRFRVA